MYDSNEPSLFVTVHIEQISLRNCVKNVNIQVKVKVHYIICTATRDAHIQYSIKKIMQIYLSYDQKSSEQAQILCPFIIRMRRLCTAITFEPLFARAPKIYGCVNIMQFRG